MRKVTTIICSIAFAVSGIAMAVCSNDSPMSSYKTMAAATLPTGNYGVPKPSLLTLGDVSDKTPTKSELDSITIADLKRQIDSLSKEQVTKVIKQKVYVPKLIVKRDTTQVPVYYLATRTEGGDSACSVTYTVKRVDEHCEPRTVD